MSTIHYGFDAVTRLGVFTASSEVKEDPRYIVVTSEEFFDIASIRLTDDNVIEIVMPTEYQISMRLEEKRAVKLTEAAGKIDLLRDVAEFTPSDEASAKLEEWRKYRAELYGATLASESDLPKSPE